MYLPPNIETSKSLGKKLNKSERLIISRTGVVERRVSVIDVDEMGAIAAKEAIGNKKLPDLIINASGVPKQVIPDTSVFIQKKLSFEILYFTKLVRPLYIELGSELVIERVLS